MKKAGDWICSWQDNSFRFRDLMCTFISVSDAIVFMLCGGCKLMCLLS